MARWFWCRRRAVGVNLKLLRFGVSTLVRAVANSAGQDGGFIRPWSVVQWRPKETGAWRQDTALPLRLHLTHDLL